MESKDSKLIKKTGRKTPKYCCICKGIYRGKVIDGRKVSLHRFPQNKRLKRVWVQRCKTVMRSFQWNEHRRLCSEHFVGFRGPSFQHTLPSMFPTETGATKTFQPTLLDEDVGDDDDGDTVNDDLDLELSNDDSIQPQLSFVSPSGHAIDTSVHLHDYCMGPVLQPQNQSFRCCDTQTENNCAVMEVQTEESFLGKTADFSSQTEHSTRDFGVQCQLPMLTYDDVKYNDDLVSFYTGIPNRVVFEALFDEIKDEAEVRTSRRKLNYKDSDGGRPRTLSVLDEFFMVLMRLRLGLLFEDLGTRFCISTSQCSDIDERWINYLHVQLSFLVQWPSREVVKNNMPEQFKEKYSNTRIIIDCTEIYSETSSSLSLKSLMYSDYKSHMTHNILVGISPNGVVTFVSDCWVGCTSDKKLTEKCGLLDLLEEGDAIMVDKGFTITDLTTPRGIHLIIPPFKQKGKQFSKREVLLTKDIASLRIHVERQMERIKNFRILHGNIPITQSRRISKVFKICTYLTNLWPPLVQ
ncbi:uncharacterized protein LOC128225206 [Mya arenaria]|uniref:uncharacterized protein LOC128225206 n=1 Tax=Mya arenaria TaxID=6604 RepID=UPI0022DF339E|nr:uncharacterized protein LOC128225206 [Mya arenaria]